MLSRSVRFLRKCANTSVQSSHPDAIRMTASEAHVETLRAHRVKDIFAIIGSAFIDSADLYEKAGIKLWHMQHEQNCGHAADAFSRISGDHGVIIGQNGPGVTNMVTCVRSAQMNHAPVVAITPEAGSDSVGKQGFQEADQMSIFKDITMHQQHVCNGARMAEMTSRALDLAKRLNGPTQLNYPRNVVYEVHDYVIPKPVQVPPPALSNESIHAVIKLIRKSQRPIILAGAGLKDSSGVHALAKSLCCPVATTYLHSDVFPHPDYWVGSLGYMGSKSAMKCVQASDLVIALGTRINPFGITQQYNIDYWDHHKPLIQVDINPEALGRSCNPTLALQADAATSARQIVDMMGTSERTSPWIDWQLENDQWRSELDETSRQPHDTALRPKAVLHALQKELKGHDNAIVTTDIGHCCSQALSYMDSHVKLLSAGTFGSCGTAIPMALGARIADEVAPIVALVGDGAVNMQCISELITSHRYNLGFTVVVFRNGVWGAELLNQLIWCDGRAVGTIIEDTPPVHKIAQAMGVRGVEVSTLDALRRELQHSLSMQKKGVTTLIEVHCSAEMGAPFRSDAMKVPVRYHPRYKDLTVQAADYQRQYQTA